MEPIPFRSLLFTAGILTRDGRMVEPGGVTWNTPMTLYGQLTDSHGGDPGPTVPLGRIDTITQQGNDYWADGFLTTDDGIYRAAPMIADLTLNGISCDLAPSVVEYRAGAGDPQEIVQQTPEQAANPEPQVEEAVPSEQARVDDMILVYVEVEIVAATVCGMPAFGESYIEIATAQQPVDPAAEGPAVDPAVPPPVAAAAQPCDCEQIVRVFTLVAAPAAPDAPPPEAEPPAPEPDDSTDVPTVAMIALYPPEAPGLAIDGGEEPDELHITIAYLGDAATLGDPTELQAICTEIASSLEPGTGRIAGPAAFVNDPDPDEADEASTPLVALIDSQWVTDLRAAVADALSASGIDIPSDHGFIPHMTMRYSTSAELIDVPQADLTFPSVWLVIGGDAQEFPIGAALTASAIGGAPMQPPGGWFNQPALDGPTPLTVDDKGRVFGHIATWGTCHTGFSGQCVTAPKSASGYAYFHLGEVVAASGQRIPVGSITLDTTHASMDKSRLQTQLHYEHTGNAVADVRAGEDRWGIWVAGAVRPDVPATSLRRLRASKISGDWRSVGGKLELIGALAVNVPGFPVPRTQARVASGVVTALVAPQIDALASDDELIDAWALIAEHGDQAIDVLAASAGGPS